MHTSLPTLISTTSALTGWSEKTLRSRAQVLKRARQMSLAKSGFAAKMTPRDAINLLLAGLYDGDSIEAAKGVKAMRATKLNSFPRQAGLFRSIHRLPDNHTFGDAIDAVFAATIAQREVRLNELQYERDAAAIYMRLYPHKESHWDHLNNVSDYVTVKPGWDTGRANIGDGRNLDEGASRWVGYFVIEGLAALFREPA